MDSLPSLYFCRCLYHSCLLFHWSLEHLLCWCGLTDASAAVWLFVGHDRSSAAPQTCQGTGPHDHRCQVWLTCWYHQGYKYILMCKLMTCKKIQSKFVCVEHVVAGATKFVRCVNTKCARNRRLWEGNMGWNQNTFVLIMVSPPVCLSHLRVSVFVCVSASVYLHIFNVVPLLIFHIVATYPIWLSFILPHFDLTSLLHISHVFLCDSFPQCNYREYYACASVSLSSCLQNITQA